MDRQSLRHAAQREGQALVTQTALLTVVAAAGDSKWAPVIGLGGQIGASALLASYSRGYEREADALGQEYMVRAGYPATGMTALHQMLVNQHSARPGLLETMFASHPMSAERRDTARRLAETKYAASASAPRRRERYMDSTASLRRIKPTIDACKAGETAMAKKAYGDAQGQFTTALRSTPQDYTANLRMAQCLHAQGKLQEARAYADAARRIYPQEAQAAKLGASLKMGLRDPAGAYADLQTYDQLLPGNPGTRFLKGVALDGMGDRQGATREFAAYVKDAPQGQAASYIAAHSQGKTAHQCQDCQNPCGDFASAGKVLRSDLSRNLHHRLDYKRLFS